MLTPGPPSCLPKPWTSALAASSNEGRGPHLPIALSLAFLM
jgi:hypothetical protein